MERRSMSIFNDKQIAAMKSGEYRCPKCGRLMRWEDEYEDVLICTGCGETIDGDRYGFTDDEYEEIYPTFDKIVDCDTDNESEIYEEVYGELDED